MSADHPARERVVTAALLLGSGFAGLVYQVLWMRELGFLFGNTGWVKANFALVTLAMIIIPGLPAVFEVLRHLWLARRARRAAGP